MLFFLKLYFYLFVLSFLYKNFILKRLLGLLFLVIFLRKHTIFASATSDYLFYTYFFFFFKNFTNFSKGLGFAGVLWYYQYQSGSKSIKAAGNSLPVVFPYVSRRRALRGFFLVLRLKRRIKIFIDRYSARQFRFCKFYYFKRLYAKHYLSLKPNKRNRRRLTRFRRPNFFYLGCLFNHTAQRSLFGARLLGSGLLSFLSYFFKRRRLFRDNFIYAYSVAFLMDFYFFYLYTSFFFFFSFFFFLNFFKVRLLSRFFFLSFCLWYLYLHILSWLPTLGHSVFFNYYKFFFVFNSLSLIKRKNVSRCAVFFYVSSFFFLIQFFNFRVFFFCSIGVCIRANFSFIRRFYYFFFLLRYLLFYYLFIFYFLKSLVRRPSTLDILALSERLVLKYSFREHPVLKRDFFQVFFTRLQLARR